MKTRISALVDGELESHEIDGTLRDLRRDAVQRAEWCDCQLIGAALRGERELGIDVTSRVMAAIDLEPVVMAPKTKFRPEWQRPVLALAASAAGVALVAWLAIAPGGEGMQTRPAALAAVTKGPQPEPAQSTPRLKEYLVAHQAYASGGAMVGGARTIRTVAASGENR